MAYTSRHTGEEIDEVVDIIQQGGGGSSNIDTELSEDSSNAIANKAVTIALNGKQDEIIVTTKPNGNIVLLGKEFMPATPSGDPMHYAYEAVGAVWNDATGAWMLNEESVTTEDIRAIYAERYISRGANMWVAYYRGSTNTTNISNCIWNHLASIADAFLGCSNIITASLGSKGATAVVNNITNAFRNCSNLRKVINPINMQYCTTTTDAFLNCSKLETVTLQNIKTSISFEQSPKLSRASLRYMIENCAENVTDVIMITVHNAVYDKIYETEEWFDLEDLASEMEEVKNTSIGFARAQSI